VAADELDMAVQVRQWKYLWALRSPLCTTVGTLPTTGHEIPTESKRIECWSDD